MSDKTKAARTLDNISAEIRQALHGAGVPAPYILVAHCLGGFYAQAYAQAYPDEVERVVFIDNTTPELVLRTTEDFDMFRKMRTKFNFMINTDLVRLSEDKATYAKNEERIENAKTMYSIGVNPLPVLERVLSDTRFPAVSNVVGIDVQNKDGNNIEREYEVEWRQNQYSVDVITASDNEFAYMNLLMALSLVTNPAIERDQLGDVAFRLGDEWFAFIQNNTLVVVKGYNAKELATELLPMI